MSFASSSSRSFVFAAMALAGSAIAFSPAAAADGQLSASYDISLGGFALAKGNLAVKVERDAYVARVGYRTAGMGKIMSGAKGEAMATGTLKPERPIPAAYNLDGSGEKKDSRVAMALAGGSIRTLDATPALKEDPERVPVRGEHKRDVMDPLSAILMPVARREAGTGPQACDRTLPIFDGWTRYDVKLSYKGTEPVQAGGYSGSAVVCAARWIPVAGHRPDRESTRFMADNRNLEVALAPVGETGVMVPVRVSIQTMSGTLLVKAEKFTVIQENQAAR